MFHFRTQGVKYGSLISPTATTEDLQDRSASYILSEEEVMNITGSHWTLVLKTALPVFISVNSKTFIACTCIYMYMYIN